jgi:hypothetical protein
MGKREKRQERDYEGKEGYGRHHQGECECHGGHGRHHWGGCGCHGGERGWGPGHGFHRRFRTREEEIADLEAYLNELKLEAQAVEERLDSLKQ